MQERSTASASGTNADTGTTRRRGASQFAWVISAVPRGVGLKKRKALLAALVEAWDAAAQAGGDDMPAVQKTAVYKEMEKTMKAKQVADELKVLARAGLVADYTLKPTL